MTGGAFRRLSALLIVSVAYGCDNVEWGGAEIRLQEPPPARIGAPPDTATAEQEAVEEVPQAPVLYMAVRDSQRVRIIPVGAILGDSIAPFPSEESSPGYRARFVRALLSPGREFVLFSQGVRVGSFTVQSVETDATFCVPRPSARGIFELIPEALQQNRFLALPREYAADYPWQPFVVPETDVVMRDATLSLPEQVLTEIDAERPSNFLNTRFHMQAFRPAGQDPPMFTVTHLIRDRLLIERPPPSASSLFLLGVPAGDRYRTGFYWHRLVARQGKGAAYLFEQMDWNKDGEAELLLEVLGEQYRWTAAVGQRNGQWTLLHEDPCGANAAPVSATG